MNGIAFNSAQSVVEIYGFPVTKLSQAEVLATIADKIRNHKKILVSTACGNSLMKASLNSEFRKHYESADIILPDGIIPVFISRFIGDPIRSKIAGPDFMLSFLNMCAGNGFSVFLMGSEENTLEQLRKSLVNRFPNLRVAGTLSPPFTDFTDEDDRRILNTINKAKPDALFVAMTAPKQEIWLTNNLHEIDAFFMMGIGYAFDVVSGKKKRAPRIMREHSLEWLYRLMTEPRRNFKRNLFQWGFLFASLWYHKKDILFRLFSKWVE